MTIAERLHAERQFHDRQAQERAPILTGLAAWQFADDSYLDHESWIRPAFDRLGDVRGRRVLDFGCGHGMAAVVLARRGASVTAFDLSGGYLAEARRRAEANGVVVELVCADGERLPFSEGAFERVWGNAVLHHLDVAVAARELRRILRPGGLAVFCEPWGENPLLRWARRRLPYPAKQRTPDEEPLRRRDLSVLRQVFGHVEVRGYQLLSIAGRLLGPGRLAGCLGRCDDALLSRLPAFQLWCRYMVLTLCR